MFHKMQGKKKMHPLEQKAKMGVVHDLQKMASDSMGDKVKGLKKVSVASNSPEGLQEGLSKAQDMVGDQDPSMMHMGGMYAEGGMTETHPMAAMDSLEEGDDHDPIRGMARAADDSHPDHENFTGSEEHEDGEDGMSAYPDADGDHLLEAHEAQAHEEDEENEGEAGMHKYAEGGEVDVEDHEDAEQREEHSEMPNYDDMDRGEMSAHLNALVAALRSKGLA